MGPSQGKPVPPDGTDPHAAQQAGGAHLWEVQSGTPSHDAARQYDKTSPSPLHVRGCLSETGKASRTSCCPSKALTRMDQEQRQQGSGKASGQRRQAEGRALAFVFGLSDQLRPVLSEVNKR